MLRATRFAPSFRCKTYSDAFRSQVVHPLQALNPVVSTSKTANHISVTDEIYVASVLFRCSPKAFCGSSPFIKLSEILLYEMQNESDMRSLIYELLLRLELRFAWRK